MSSLPSLNEYNQMFNRIFESRTEVKDYYYLTVSNGHFAVTTDQSEAINLKNLNAKVSLLTKGFIEATKMASKEKNQYQILAKNLGKYSTQEYINNKTDFPEPTSRTIQLFIEATHRKPIMEASSSSKDENTDYGFDIKTKKVFKFDDEGKIISSINTAVRQNLRYSDKEKEFEDMDEEQVSEKIRHQKMEKSLASIKNDKNVSIQDIEWALSEQINVLSRNIKKTNPGFISAMIIRLLERLTDLVETGELKKITVQYFTRHLTCEMIQSNIKSESIDRSTFKILSQIGNTKHEHRPLAGTYVNMDQLKEEYKNGTWQEEETRIITYSEVSDSMLNFYCKAIEKFENNKTLQKILDHYVNGLSSPKSF